MVAFKDYYAILGIHHDATPNELRDAYRILSQKWHPDKNPDRDVTTIMQDINEAYAMLKDANRRERYDVEYSQYRVVATRKEGEHDTYNVRDEEVAKDIQNAITYAKKLVDEFLKSLKKVSGNAARGAWEEAKGYVITGLILSLLSILVLCII